MTLREHYEELERATLADYATLAANSAGRAREEEPCPIRTCFQRDIDRVIHSKAFRRLKHKTQVFLRPEGDHYRTRLTHTLEVARIARTIVRGLRLNEDLVEAQALAHDLGHTPFGHAGEYALDEVVPGGFAHNEQSARVVEILERNGKGLNLSAEVVDGALCHSGDAEAMTPEGRVLKFADRIAYINHDIDDAIRAGILRGEDIPKRLRDTLGETYSERINTMVLDVILSSDGGEIRMSDTVGPAMNELRDFMFERVYRNPIAKGEEGKAKEMLKMLYCYYAEHPEALPEDDRYLVEEYGAERAAADYISGMTDNYAVERFTELFIPYGWTKHS